MYDRNVSNEVLPRQGKTLPHHLIDITNSSTSSHFTDALGLRWNYQVNTSQKYDIVSQGDGQWVVCVSASTKINARNLVESGIMHNDDPNSDDSRLLGLLADQTVRLERKSKEFRGKDLSRLYIEASHYVSSLEQSLRNDSGHLPDMIRSFLTRWIDLGLAFGVRR